MVKKMTKKTIEKGHFDIGKKAPDFELLNQNEELVKLSHFKGKKVLLYFYPKAMTPGCTTQACGLRDSEKMLKKLNLVVLGVSPDPVDKLKKFEEKYDLNFQLLSDPDHLVALSYKSWGPKVFMGKKYDGILRQSFLIDEKGCLAKVMEKVNTKTHHEDIFDLISNLE
jgi:peroxiredoxin Q/BCP